MKVDIIDALPNQYNQVLRIVGVELEPDIIQDFMKVPVHAISMFLGLKKNREEAGTSLILRDENGNFIISGIVKYHAPEIADQAGNWSYNYSWNEEDTKNLHNYNVTDTSFIEVVQNIAYKHNLEITEPDFILTLLIGFFESLKNVLEQNANPTEEFEVESDGFFVATVAVEGDEKVYSLVPSGEMKRLIKDDSTLEG